MSRQARCLHPGCRAELPLPASVKFYCERHGRSEKNPTKLQSSSCVVTSKLSTAFFDLERPALAVPYFKPNTDLSKGYYAKVCVCLVVSHVLRSYYQSCTLLQVRYPGDVEEVRFFHTATHDNSLPFTVVDVYDMPKPTPRATRKKGKKRKQTTGGTHSTSSAKRTRTNGGKTTTTTITTTPDSDSVTDDLRTKSNVDLKNLLNSVPAKEGKRAFVKRLDSEVAYLLKNGLSSEVCM